MLTPKPEKQKRRRCLNDGKLFTPAKNVPKQKFCKDACRKEFHRHGSAFGAIKLGLYKAIDKKYAALLKDQAARNKVLATSVLRLQERVNKLELLLGEPFQQGSEAHGMTTAKKLLARTQALDAVLFGRQPIPPQAKVESGQEAGTKEETR